ncbi:TA system toxin CbtA family protein [Citrobacter sp. Cpo107]|nr:TA system toxin CbtA family protein [Citrobacter sp. Cpo107]MDM2805486.1 toxin [Citrobacter sp. Cpo107]
MTCLFAPSLTLNDTPLCGETVIQKHTNAGINFG